MAVKHNIPTAASDLSPEPGERIVQPFQRFAKIESSSGIVLLLCTVAALIWANSGAAPAYERIFDETLLTFGFGEISLSKDLVHWINDALMAIFFLLVGLEIKREVLTGELGSLKQAALPIAGAIGGMLVPALVYVAFNFGTDGIGGWGVPMATDIAFALGVMALLGDRVPTSLRVFLTSLAIVDDIGALLVIALFYTEQIDTAYLVAAGAAVAVLIVLNRMRVRTPLIYLIPGIALWYFVFKSGVHATIAGVVLALTIPASSRVDAPRFLRAGRHALDQFEKEGQSSTTSGVQRAAVRSMITSCRQVLPPLHRIEDGLHPWVAFLIVPIFALANAGVPIGGDAGGQITGRISLGIMLGLFVGKPAGIFLLSLLAVKLGLATLPRGVTWRHVLGAGFLGGIGFTMALFIANLAFDKSNVDVAKLGILVASAASGIFGVVVLLGAKRPADAQPA